MAGTSTGGPPPPMPPPPPPPRPEEGVQDYPQGGLENSGLTLLSGLLEKVFLKLTVYSPFYLVLVIISLIVNAAIWGFGSRVIEIVFDFTHGLI